MRLCFSSARIYNRTHDCVKRKRNAAFGFANHLEALKLNPGGGAARLWPVNGLAITVSVLSLLGHVGLGVFFYGRFYGEVTKTVAGHGDRISKVEESVEQHQGEIGVLYGRAGISR